MAKEHSVREESLEETLERLSKSLDAAAESWKRTDELIEEIGESCHEAIRSGLGRFVDQLQEERAGPQEDRERVLQALTRFEDLLAEHLDRILNDRRETLGQLEELSETIRESVRTSLLEVGRKLDSREEDVGRKLIQGVERLGRELREMNSRFSFLPDGQGPRPGERSSGSPPWLPPTRPSPNPGSSRASSEPDSEKES